MELLFKIVVCDDDADFLDSLCNKIAKIADHNNCKCEITKLYSGSELIGYCKNHSSDIIITDIDMPDISNAASYQTHNMEGFKAAKELQEENPETEIMFVSAHEELAYQSFRYRPFSFVSKRDLQILEDDLGELLRKLKKRKSKNSLVHLSIGEHSYSINTDDVMYFKSDKHYIKAYMAGGSEKTYRLSINDAYNQLKDASFIFIHRSYLVNCRFIKYFNTQLVILENDLEINVTRNEDRLNEAKRIFGRYKWGLR